MDDVGFVGVIIVGQDDEVIAGVAALTAARMAGINEVPVLRASHLSKAQVKRFRIFHNKIAEASSRDEQALKIEFVPILLDEPGLIELTGFNTTEIDIILDGTEADEDASDNDGIVARDVAVSRLGDVFLLAVEANRTHKLICGDAKEQASYQRLLGGERAALIASDFPYNLALARNIGRSRPNGQREFVEASGEMTPEGFSAFLEQVLAAMQLWIPTGGLLYLFMDWRNVHRLINAALRQRLDLLNLAVWDKMTGGMGNLYRSTFELIPIFKKSAAPHTNNVQLGRYGRNRENVWRVPGLNQFSKDRQELLASHPTIKPTKLFTDIIKDASNRGDIVLDPFVGSGTTIIAAELTGRVARAIELDPVYVDLCIRRFEKRFGVEATHQETGLTFRVLAEQRRQGAGNSLRDRPVRRPPPPMTMAR